MASPEEKKNRKIAFAVATGFQLLLLVVFFFLVAWRKPDPPLPEYGIELDFGTDIQGTGSTAQPEPTPVVEEVVEEVETEEVEEVVEPEPAEPEPEPVEEVVTEPEPEPVAEAPVETQPEESPAVVEEVEESAEEVVAEPEPEPEPKPAVKEESLYPGTSQPAANQGDDADEIGDKGTEKGTIDQRALYGARGSADGASLQMAGWNWDNIPRPDDSSNENGRIVFEVTIDDQGEIIGVRTVEKTVSPTVERAYRRAVEQLTFSTTTGNVRPAPTSTGRITFVIRAK